MSLSPSENAQLLFAIILLLSAAHAFGFLFARLKQPRVIGEIIGGLLLGPTVLGAAWPEAERALFASGRVTPPVLGALVQFGLQLLMFVSGTELRSTLDRGERRTAAIVSAAGLVIPFAAGLLFFRMTDAERLLGAARNEPALLVVVAVGIAVTSIPVISRIMIDLGIIGTSFARIVLAAAVIEDIVLYVALAVALGMVTTRADAVGVPALVPSGAPRDAYHVVVTLFFFGISLAVGPRAYRRFAGSRYDVLRHASPIGAQLVFLLCMTTLALVLGVASMFGAFVAGVIVGVGGGSGAEGADDARDAIKRFAMAFFVPIYFASVGLKLDLRNDLDVGFVAVFGAYACLVKAASVYGGAKLAGESEAGARNLAVVMNARGGPGIVLAQVAYDARIVNGRMYATLVILALTTSAAAGAWLESVVRKGRALR